MHVTPASPPTRDTDHRRRHHLGGTHRRADDGCPEEHGGGAGLARERVERSQSNDASADRADDRPAAKRGAGGQRGSARKLSPHRRRKVRRFACREEQCGHDSNRLLRIVRAVGQLRDRPTSSTVRRVPARARESWRDARHAAPIGSRRDPPARPKTGANASTPITPSTPTGLIPSNPPQFTAPVPPSASAAPTNPPSSACPELDGRARHQVIAFHATAPVSAAPITKTTSSLGTVTIPAIVSATALPRIERSDHVAHCREHNCRTRPSRTRRDQRCDRVRCIVQTVGERERQRHPNRDHHSSTHQQSLLPPQPRRARRSTRACPTDREPPNSSPDAPDCPIRPAYASANQAVMSRRCEPARERCHKTGVARLVPGAPESVRLDGRGCAQAVGVRSR